MRKLFSRSIAKIVTILSLTSLVQSAQFRLPNGTLGRQEIVDPLGQVQPNTVFVNGKFCEHVIVPETTCHLYFPIDGSQPTTAEAGQYSGARYDNPDNNRVTDWWVRVFGGNNAVNMIHRGIYDRLLESQMGFDRANNPVHIIRVNAAGAPVNFEQQFWQNFCQIAADPVGRVLLYRLLIEIRRVDDAGLNGVCEGRIITRNERNFCRSLFINYSNHGCSFNPVGNINFDTNNNIQTFTFFQNVNNFLTTQAERRDRSIGLFHEMLHWFHFLRSSVRFTNNRNYNIQNYRYVGNCYYGNISELYLWGLNSEIKLEEIATILGTPNYNFAYNHLIHTEAFFNNHGVVFFLVRINEHDRYIPNADHFFNGDDLSENVYRASQGCHMRFGHTNRAITPLTMYPIPNRFQLAHQVAVICYTQITGNAPQNWALVQGEAIQ